MGDARAEKPPPAPWQGETLPPRLCPDAGELKTLAETGITAISLATSLPASSIILGNTVRAVATVTFASGLTSTISDVVLESNQLDSVFLGNAAVSTAAAASLKLKGYGNTTNLDVAMTNDASLLTLVNGFKTMSASSSWDMLKAAADDILFRWAGVSGVTPTAMTSAFDLQKLAFLEAFSEVLVHCNGIKVANDDSQFDTNVMRKAA